MTNLAKNYCTKNYCTEKEPTEIHDIKKNFTESMSIRNYQREKRV